jgi:hypothetical protein
MDKEEYNVGNCPHCTKVIFRDGKFNSEATFTTRCPHCQKPLRVTIRKRIEIIIMPLEPKPGCKIDKKITGGLIVLIVVLYLPPLINFLSDASDILDALT